MDISALLKKHRIKNELTQEQLAEKMYVSHQTISKWETGINVPSIDNLLLLSDLYNISLDELIRGSSYFRKPFIFGRRFSLSLFLKVSVIWLLLCTVLSGFLYQVPWLFWSFFLLGELNIMGIVIEDYWVITNKGILLCSYPETYLKKMGKLLRILAKKDTNEALIPYKEIQSMTLIYAKKFRMSPMDTHPDAFYIKLTDTTGDTKRLAIPARFTQFLPQVVSYVGKRNITVYDENHLIPAIVDEQNLHDYMNRKG